MPIKIPVDKYLGSDIFADVGISQVSPEEREEFMARIAEVIQHKIEFRVMDSLTDDQKTELDGLLERDAQGSEILQFFESALPDFDAIAAEETAKYKKELVDKMAA